MYEKSLEKIKKTVIKEAMNFHFDSPEFKKLAKIYKAIENEAV